MTWLYQSPQFLKHVTGAHPESPQRLSAIEQRLKASGLLPRCQTGLPRLATVEELARIHGRDYIQSVEDMVQAGGGRIEADTVVSPHSYETARLAAGTAIHAVDAVLSGENRTALCLIRPPGHHALADSAMGFCLFNNIAIAAEHARQRHQLDRILIIDWDVHHGNGTQDLFYRRSDVTFFSAHRFPFYPGTGSEAETGSGPGLGATFNLPLAADTPSQQYLQAFERMLQDAAKRCRPQLILLSAGFDAHQEDPIGGLGLNSEDFVALTRMVLGVAQEFAQGRLVSLLEGGYNVQRLAECVEVHLTELLSPLKNDGENSSSMPD